MMTTTGGDEVFSRSEIVLLGSVETMLEKIYGKHNHHPPIKVETRRKLSSISEELALETLRKVLNMEYVKTLDGIIMYFVNNAATVDGSPRLSSGESPLQSPTTPGKKEVSLDGEDPSPKFLRRDETGRTNHIPPLVALGELEFKKAFLLLTYLGGDRFCYRKSLGEVISGDEIRQWKDLPMVAYESAVWFKLGQNEQRISLESDSGKTHYYQCHVTPDGSYRFKGYLLENTGTHLHKVLGDDNVLTVKFDQLPKESTYCNDPYSKHKEIAKNGIMVGLRRYQIFVFKDGGKAEKKKRNSTKQVKCYFIRMDSTASSDMENPYILAGMSIHEARMHFMHVHTLPSPANYMARFSLILSKTKKLEVDMTGITVKQIDDIHCHDQSNNDVLDKNGKPRIHSDGTGYISEDLARMCPVNIFKGKNIKSDIIQGKTCGQEPPLLIQIRMFNDGSAVKGIFLLNKNLPPRTVQVRPSMIKVYKDKNLSNFSTFNSLEVVTTSNPPKRAKLSKNLVALLSYGGVPNDFFLDILLNTLEKKNTVFFKIRAAGKGSMRSHMMALFLSLFVFCSCTSLRNMDDKNALQMIMAGIPLDEPYLKHHLSLLLKIKKDDLKAGRLPIDESYYLMGTVDPTGELKEDEVCVILNPGLHFGDIHILQATYVKTLEQYVGNSKYAVFFPQKGPRSLGDEIAGGDFDGDMYFISRNPKLLEHYKPSEPWVSSSPPSKIYTGRKPSELSPEQLEEELFNMFLKTGFSPSNVIGQAADSWLGIMDRFLTLGDENAIDAPKTGTEVNLPFDVKADVFPHYMERNKIFKSISILGLIFDTVDSHNAEDPTPSALGYLSEISKLQCFEDEPVSEFDMEKCKSWHKDYRKEMCQAMHSDDDSCDEVIQKYKKVSSSI
ncbi:hypothetical protein ARALYDRAFT_319567 [Arabidopsis lyrata subsp. lyrata]|uniref:RNA-dependent RNA polymerase n=1 Tax=Arabidopsis lyrata subsp. lyrata TaxID=81972 RepID=D7L6F4_ARALL|nr:hypothetical protein ARALYDRAFT_319567 [Arabidopsis lyrata subsp. lyrata]